MDTNCISVLIAVQLQPLETVCSTEMPIQSSAQFLFAVVGFGDKSCIWRGVENGTFTFASNQFGVQTVECGL